MRITLRGLMIYVAFADVALGLARLPPFVGSACQVLEIMVLGFVVPARLRFRLSLGYIAGILLGLVVATTYDRRVEVTPTGLLSPEAVRTGWPGWGVGSPTGSSWARWRGARWA